MQRYAITDRALLPQDDRQSALCRQVAGWTAGGVEWVQIREKDLPQEELVTLVRRASALCGQGTRLLVNGLAPELAIANGADGVHLPGGFSAEQVRAAVESMCAVTVSCHALDEVKAARDAGASAALWSPVFGKAVGGLLVQPGVGLEALAAACAAAAPMPVFALGGVTPENAESCVRAGAAGVAGIRLFCGERWKLLA